MRTTGTTTRLIAATAVAGALAGCEGESIRNRDRPSSADAVETASQGIYAGPISKPADLKYCFTNNHAWNEYVREGLRKSWEMESSIYFKEVPCNQGPHTNVTISDSCKGHFSDGNNILIFTCGGTANVGDVAMVAIHEMGHQLSFGHENNANRPEVTPECADPDGGLGTEAGPFDRASIMLGKSAAGDVACGFTVSDNLTETDIAGVQEFYGGPRAAAPTSWGSNRVDVFFRAKGGNTLLHGYTATGGQQAWGVHDMGGRFWGSPAAVAPTENRLLVFGRNAYNFEMHFREWTGSIWTDWTSLGGWTKGVPTALHRRAGVVDVFTRGTNDLVYRKTWTNGTWSQDWENTDASFRALGQLTAVTTGYNTIDLLARAQDRSLAHNFWDGTQWSGFQVLPSSVGHESPAATSWGEGRMDVFTNNDGTLQHHYKEHPGGWGQWPLGPSVAMTGSPAAVAPFVNRLDVFYRTHGGALMNRRWNGSGWLVPITIATGITGDPSATSESNRVHVFYKKGNRFFVRTIVGDVGLTTEVEFGIDAI